MTHAQPPESTGAAARAERDAELARSEPTGWPSDATRDHLVGDWYLWQRRGGHRTSTDDQLTAWLAADLLGDARPARYLDLGCGIGSVLLMTAHATQPATAVGVEAQAQSAEMARRSCAALAHPDGGHDGWIRVVHADIRDVSAASLGGAFDLVTGSPPYLPLGTGVVSPDPQRAACRFELRGGVEAYCAAAAACLAPDGLFALVFQTEWDDRVHAAAEAAGLVPRAQADVRTRVDRPAPFLSVYAFGAPGSSSGEFERRTFAVRDADGSITPAYAQVRARLGLRVG